MDAAPGRAPLPDISADEPTGENLEFDPAFAELERLAQGKPEQQYGSTVVPAEEPMWKDVAAAARALLERSHDLRVMALLCVARLHREGVPGYADALGMVRGLLETRWAPLHPQLDPEDDNDPTLRANALLAVAEPVRVLRVLRLLPLARSPRAGTVCWRDIAISQGTLEVEDAPRLSETVIGATFRDTDPAVLATLRLAIGEALDHSIAIPGIFDHEAGHGTGPDFNDLTKLLREMAQMVDRYAVLPDAAPEPEAAPVAGEAAPAAAAPRAPQAVSIATLAPPTNRQDALRLLDLVIAYYTEHEPSSPLPMLVARARRMAEMNFMDILRDMAPDAVSQAEVVTGRPGDD